MGVHIFFNNDRVVLFDLYGFEDQPMLIYFKYFSNSDVFFYPAYHRFYYFIFRKKIFQQKVIEINCYNF